MKRRFDNAQLIVNKHMKALLDLPVVNSITTSEDWGTCMTQWRRTCEGSEHLEWLQTLMVACWPQSCWASSPQLIISKSSPKRNGMWGNLWRSLTKKSMLTEGTTNHPNPSSLLKKQLPRRKPTAAGLMATNSIWTRLLCFCEQGHASGNTTLAKIVDPQDVATNVMEDITIPFAHTRTRVPATHQ